MLGIRIDRLYDISINTNVNATYQIHLRVVCTGIQDPYTSTAGYPSRHWDMYWRPRI